MANGQQSRLQRYQPIPVNLLSDGSLRKDGLVFDGFSDCYRIKSTKQELFKVTWKSNVRALVVEPPPDLNDDEVDSY